jgi:hypothetical protein
MKVRSAATVVLLLVFPVSIFAQTRLDLKSIKVVTDEPANKPVPLRPFKLPAHDFAQTAKASCAESEARGRTDADRRGLHKGWFWGGMGVGAAVGIFSLVTPAIAAINKPKPKQLPPGVDTACYATGYGSKARHENALSAFWGNLAGTAVFWTLFLTGAWG